MSDWIEMSEDELVAAIFADSRDHDCFVNDDGCGFCNECGSMLVRS